MTVSGGAARSSAINGRRSLLAKPFGLEPKQRQRGEQGMAALLTQAQAWDAGAGRGGDGCGDGVQGIGPR